jgi:hypothetical protein
MHETKSKWFKKVLRATLCLLCAASSVAYTYAYFY